jgi:hypothetical protein
MKHAKFFIRDVNGGGGGGGGGGGRRRRMTTAFVHGFNVWNDFICIND